MDNLQWTRNEEYFDEATMINRFLINQLKRFFCDYLKMKENGLKKTVEIENYVKLHLQQKKNLV